MYYGRFERPVVVYSTMGERNRRVRDQVISAVADLADEASQRDWLRSGPQIAFDNIHFILEAFGILDDPIRGVGSYLFEDEAQKLSILGSLINAMTDEVPSGDDPDYFLHGYFKEIRQAARSALETLISREIKSGPKPISGLAAELYDAMKRDMER